MSAPIVSVDHDAIKADLSELVRKTVEDALNALLAQEADDLIGASRYERTAEREAYRAGHYDRGLVTTSGEVTIRMPKLKGMRFATAIIDRYKRRETSVEEAMIEMRLAGVSTRRIEDVSEILGRQLRERGSDGRHRRQLGTVNGIGVDSDSDSFWTDCQFALHVRSSTSL